MAESCLSYGGPRLDLANLMPCFTAFAFRPLLLWASS